MNVKPEKIRKIQHLLHISIVETSLVVHDINLKFRVVDYFKDWWNCFSESNALLPCAISFFRPAEDLCLSPKVTLENVSLSGSTGNSVQASPRSNSVQLIPGLSDQLPSKPLQVCTLEKERSLKPWCWFSVIKVTCHLDNGQNICETQLETTTKGYNNLNQPHFPIQFSCPYYITPLVLSKLKA